VVVLNFYAVLSGKGLKGMLGSDRLDPRIVDLKMNKAEAAVVINEDGCTPVPLLGEFSLHLCIETNLSRRHLVDGDALPQFHCNKDLVRSLGLLSLPWDLGHRSEEIACALGGLDLG
jgi:hypothetical protein